MPTRLMDQLDDGWERLQEGELEAALEAAHRALRMDPRNVGGHVLVGAALFELDQAEAALSSFRSALAIDPDDVEALLYAAEAQTVLGNPSDSVPLCERAVELSDSEELRLDAQILRIEAYLALGDREAAAQYTRELPEPPYPDWTLELRAAEAALEVGEIERADRWARAFVEEDPDAAEGHYFLGLVAERRNDLHAMTRAFLRVRELDLREPAPSWGIPAKEFQSVAEEAFEELPEHIRKRLENVPIIASDYPSAEVVAEGCDPRMMGFFSGVPYPEKAHAVGQPPHLDCIFLYQRNIERFSRSREELLEEIRKTLLHETGHFFALDDDDLEAIGLG